MAFKERFLPQIFGRQERAGTTPALKGEAYHPHPAGTVIENGIQVNYADDGTYTVGPQVNYREMFAQMDANAQARAEAPNTASLSQGRGFLAIKEGQQPDPIQNEVVNTYASLREDPATRDLLDPEVFSAAMNAVSMEHEVVELPISVKGTVFNAAEVNTK